MASSNKPNQISTKTSKVGYARFVKGLSYAVYFYVISASVTLMFGFLLLLFGADRSAPFVDFIYNLSIHFLAPFRGIFPVRNITDGAYFSTTALFAIIVYGVVTIAIQSFITFIALKQAKLQDELDEYLDQAEEK